MLLELDVAETKWIALSSHLRALTGSLYHETPTTLKEPEIFLISSDLFSAYQANKKQLENNSTI